MCCRSERQDADGTYISISCYNLRLDARHLTQTRQDRLHQPYRQALFPAMLYIIEAAIAAGAHGASLSGGGLSLIALVSTNQRQVLRAMEETARAHGVEGTGRILRADQQGARVIKAPRALRNSVRKDEKVSHADQFYWSPARATGEPAVNE